MKLTAPLKILDCTLRDGGYYTNWDFDSSVVDSYIRTTNKLPIDYIEVGYRNNPSKEYLGKFGYTPVPILQKIRRASTKKIAVMLNEKSTKPEDLGRLVSPIKGLADMIRIAVDPANFERAVILAKAIKEIGFEVGFNIMYMSKWESDYPDLLDKIGSVGGIVDVINMVDSFGGITPEEVKDLTIKVKSRSSCKVGFHGHNNLQLGLINTLTAIGSGVDIVDATAIGMGRGAGNLNMELLLTYLKNMGIDVDFNILGEYVQTFQPLWEQYHWGTNLPYMIAGANKIPQKEVMAWVNNRAYSFNSIVRALDNKRNHIEDNARYPIFESGEVEEVMIIGGGRTCIEHRDAIKHYMKQNPRMAIIFSSSRHADLYHDVDNRKYYVLVGNEAKRLSGKVLKDRFNGKCILAPYPRVMGTEVPDFAEGMTYELEKITFVSTYQDSCTTVALQTALALKARSVFMVGYDGYKGEVLSDKEMELSKENRTIFEAFIKSTGISIISLTPSNYNLLDVKSVYQYL